MLAFWLDMLHNDLCHNEYIVEVEILIVQAIRGCLHARVRFLSLVKDLMHRYR
jgi:hypothetical protein